MRERIMRLSRGIVDAEMPKLFLDPVKVEETLGSDTVYKRELYLASENNLYIKGLAYSSHSRVKILKSAFGGLRNHIVYEVDTSWCENGDLIKGNFTLVTNSGELEVPFLFRVEMIESVRVLSTLKSMDDFVELADSLGFKILGLTFSPVKGPEGNIEFLGHLSLNDVTGIRPDTALVVEQAHAALDKGAEV